MHAPASRSRYTDLGNTRMCAEGRQGGGRGESGWGGARRAAKAGPPLRSAPAALCPLGLPHPWHPAGRGPSSGPRWAEAAVGVFAARCPPSRPAGWHQLWARSCGSPSAWHDPAPFSSAERWLPVAAHTGTCPTTLKLVQPTIRGPHAAGMALHVAPCKFTNSLKI